MSYDRYLIIDVMVLVLLVGTMMCSVAQSDQASFYVATNGNDAWSGTLPAPNAAGTDGPFATLSRARDAIRELKANGGLHQPLKVLVRGGSYYLPETLTLEPQDSGTASFPITYMAYPGEQPVLSGGRPITGWRPYRGKIWQCDLNALGLGELSFKQLFYNGEWQPCARFPNVDPQRPRTGGFLYVYEGGIKGSKVLLKYDPIKLDPSKWAKPTLAEVDVMPHHNWNNNFIPIAKIDQANHIITLAAGASYDLTRATHFYIQNAFEELDAPGEWYLDTESSTLYFWPPDDNLAAGQIVVPVLDNIIHIKGEGANNPVGYLRLGGFALQVCRSDAVRMRTAQHCTIAKCTITNTGHHGVCIDKSQDNRVVGNDIAYTGAGGIYVDGRNNLVSNNHIYDTGVILKRYPGITIRGRGNIASHNLIHDVPSVGIIFLGYDHIIEYNDIHHFGLGSSVAGGIYAFNRGLENAYRVGGNILRFNHISDSVGYDMISLSPGQFGPYPYMGIWLDDNINNTTIYGNILVRNYRGGMVIHGGENNIIANNIMGAGIPNTSNHIRPGDEPCNNRISRNIVYYANASPDFLRKYGWRVKSVNESASRAAATPVDLCGWSSVKAAVAESDYNLFWPIRARDVDALLYYRGAGRAWRGPWADEPVADRFTWWRSQGYEAHSIIADPLFADVTHDDYSLPPDSPAFRIGFKPIPQERIGLYPSPNRASWPVPDQREGWQGELVVRAPTPPQPRPQFRAANDTAGIIVDGDISEWPWNDASRVMVVAQQSNGLPTSAPKSYASVAYDDEALYIAVRNLVRDVKRLKSRGEWGETDAVEIPFQDVSGEKPGPILNLYGFPDGHFERAADTPVPPEAAKKLEQAATYAAQIGADYWSCEWRIPWAATGIDPKKSKKVWFNIGVRKTVAEAWVIWKGTNGASYYLENAGDLILLP